METISKGIDAESGLTLKRQFIDFIPKWSQKEIEVFYAEWLETVTGLVVNKQRKSYICADYDYYNDDEVLVEVRLFTKWMEYPIVNGMVGKKLGDDVIIGSINYTLGVLPIGVENRYKLK